MESGPDEARILRRHARDLTALLALPAMWHRREPAYIMGSLLDVLLGLLRLDSAYVRFDDPDGGPAIEDWRPQSPAPPEELVHAVAAPLPGEPAVSVAAPAPTGRDTIRVARLSPGFLYEHGVVLAGSRRTDFPTELEQVRLQAAVDQATISIHGAYLLARERAARAAAEKLAAEQEAILRQIADGVVIADAAGRITFVNEAARRHFGFNTLSVTIEDNAATRPPLQRDGRPWSPEELPLACAVRGETIIAADMRVRRSDGQEIAALASATPLVAEDGAQFGAVMTIYDVSAQHALERQKDEFLANVSHDLRTPLAAIVASIGVVLANEPPDMPAPLHRMLVNSEQAAERMTRLVDNLLELTRMQAGRVQLWRALSELRDLARRVADSISPLAQTRGQRVALDLPAEPVPALVDAQRLEQVLLNLLSNAHKYGREGGTIRLSLMRRPGDVVLGVTDDGPGITAVDQERIFDRYYRSETEAIRHKQGSGLGLPIARALVELHGGRLWVESQPGAGATFWIALPMEPHAPAEREEPL
ncbi:MAG TPA: ATP-binding protein [Chloroflexota bacterium]|jgi:PAS domain S-box-containing protein|nr:ATP-binding protein [Chloroflexota bacterium]